MKKFFFIVILISITFFSYSIANPVEGKGAMLIKVQVNMMKRFFDLEKGTYKDRILILIYNTKTGKKYEEYLKDGYACFLNIIPGNYEVGYWSLKGDQSSFADYLATEKVKFEIKPNTVTILDEYDVSITYKEEINNWDSFQGQLDTHVTTTINKKSKESIKTYFLEKIDKKKIWKDVVFN